MERKVTDILSPEEIMSLPSWVKEDIDNAYFVPGSDISIEISNGRRYCITNKINDLSGAEWTSQLCSVLNTRYSTRGEESYAHHIRKVHPSPKPPQLMRDLIQFFTKENETADAYIEKATHELCKNNRVYVATSDGLEQMIILGQGAIRIPTSQFLDELKKADEAMQKIIAEHNKQNTSKNPINLPF